jgi:hypothetical protein
MKYLVTVIKDKDEENIGVEVAGVFDTSNQADIARQHIENWLQTEGFDNYEIFVSPIKVNQLMWYDIDKEI